MLTASGRILCDLVSMMGVASPCSCFFITPRSNRAQARRRRRDAARRRHRARCQNAREGWGLSALSRRAVGGRHGIPDVKYLARRNREHRDDTGAYKDRCNALYAADKASKLSPCSLGGGGGGGGGEARAM